MNREEQRDTVVERALGDMYSDYMLDFITAILRYKRLKYSLYTGDTIR